MCTNVRKSVAFGRKTVAFGRETARFAASIEAITLDVNHKYGSRYGQPPSRFAIETGRETRKNTRKTGF